MPDVTANLVLWWSDKEWAIDWNASADAAAAFRLAVDIAARLNDSSRVT